MSAKRTISKGLQPGDNFHCDVCGEIHAVQLQASLANTGTAARQMLYTFCTKPRPGKYFVGTIGGWSNRGPKVRRKKETALMSTDRLRQ